MQGLVFVSMGHIEVKELRKVVFPRCDARFVRLATCDGGVSSSLLHTWEMVLAARGSTP